MKTATVIIAIAIQTTAVSAQEPQELSYSAESLVMMLSSEKACNLSYDKSAIENYVKHFSDQNKTIKDLGSLVAFNQNYVVKEMSRSTLIAHCAQVRDTANKYGFIK